MFGKGTWATNAAADAFVLNLAVSNEILKFGLYQVQFSKILLITDRKEWRKFT